MKNNTEKTDRHRQADSSLGAHHNHWDPPLFQATAHHPNNSESAPDLCQTWPGAHSTRAGKQCHHGGSGCGGRLNLSQQPEAPVQTERR